MRFIPTDKGFVNLDRITRIFERHDGLGVVYFGNDESAVTEDSCDKLAIGAIIPAVHGHSVVWANVDNEGAFLDELPVIAWEVGRYEYSLVIPYTIRGRHVYGEHAIKMPDGKVENENGVWDSTDDFLKAEKERYAKQVKEILK